MKASAIILIVFTSLGLALPTNLDTTTGKIQDRDVTTRDSTLCYTARVRADLLFAEFQRRCTPDPHIDACNKARVEYTKALWDVRKACPSFKEGDTKDE